jgi:hypothetical protein
VALEFDTAKRTRTTKGRKLVRNSTSILGRDSRLTEVKEKSRRLNAFEILVIKTIKCIRKKGIYNI